MTIDATKHCADPLTSERLFGWHAALFPTGYSGMRTIRVGAWRDDADGPMRILTPVVGHERVHFEAPPAARIEAEMAAFLAWFNQPPKRDGLVSAALAHLWFVTIHPQLVGEMERTCRGVIESRGSLFTVINRRLWGKQG